MLNIYINFFNQILQQWVLNGYSSPTKLTQALGLEKTSYLDNLRHIVITTLIDARLVYYRSQWGNVRGLIASDANCSSIAVYITSYASAGISQLSHSVQYST